ncbi:MAG: tetratricopeptide repeat protein [Clostridium sp.]|nr:tetratricopeptide repeat protein [Clostridium sp.]
MIDLKAELKNYPLVQIDELERNNPDISSDMRDSLILYNKALEKLHAGSEDIAIIELKKAISLNPDFYEANNLLGIVYAHTKDFNKAEHTFKKVIDAEKSGVRALNYLREIGSDYEFFVKQGSKGRKKGKDTASKKYEGLKNERDSALFLNTPLGQERHKTKTIVGILLGFILGSLLVFALSFKYYGMADNEEILCLLIEEKTNAIEQRDKIELENKELLQRYNDLNEQFNEATKQADYYLGVAKLLDIEKLVLENKITKAADELLLLGNNVFEGAGEEKYRVLLDKVMNKAAQIEFNEGKKIFDAGNYREALGRFDKSRSYSEDWSYAVNNLYHCGVCYQELNNTTIAVKTFEELIEKYPSSAFAQYSRNRINQIENTQ